MKRCTNLFTLWNRDIIRHRRAYTTVGLLFLIGIVLGTFYAYSSDACLTAEASLDIFFSAYPMQSVSYLKTFQLSLLHYIEFGVILWLSGQSPWLLPLGLIQILAKSFRLGYAISCLIRLYYLRGVAFSLLSLWPQNFILIPMICFYTVRQINFCTEKHTHHGWTPAKKQLYSKNLMHTVLFLSTLCLCAAIEGLAIPAFLHPITSVLFHAQ